MSSPDTAGPDRHANLPPSFARDISDKGQVLRGGESCGFHQEQERIRILRQRARVLAQAPDDLKPNEARVEFIGFRLGTDKYGIQAGCLREILQCNAVTPVPSTPPYVAGVISVRGQIVSVIDLKVVLDLPPRMAAPNPCAVLILRSEAMEFGILADEVSGFYMIALSTIQPGAPGKGGHGQAYFLGTTVERMLLLDGWKLLSDPGLVVKEDRLVPKEAGDL